MWHLYTILRKLNALIFKMMGYFLRSFFEPKDTHLDICHWGLQANARGHLVIGGCDTEVLARTYGTPLFVVDEERLRRNYRNLLRAYRTSYPHVEIFYSYKTNPVPGILQILHQEGAGAEVISPYELWLALKLKVPPGQLIYNGVYKDLTSLEIAIKQEVRLINVDSFGELEKLAQIAKRFQKRPHVGVRVSTGFGWASQFGLQIQTGEALRAYKRMVELDCFNICGIHTHLGTGIRSISEYQQAIKSMIALMGTLKSELNLTISSLDIGGGFGVPTVRSLWEVDNYMPYPAIPDIQKTPSINQFSKEISDTIQEECKRYNIPLPKLFLEPGRAITSDSQILLLSAASVKKQLDGSQYIIADGGLNLAYPLNWEYHELFVANRIEERPQEKYTVVGPLCTPTDLLYKSKILPSVSEGDILAVMDAGAYFISYMNTFSFPRPGIVVVSQGKSRLIRKAEDFDEVTALDTIFTERTL